MLDDEAFAREAADFANRQNRGDVPGPSTETQEESQQPINIAVIGETRIGKSSFINALIGEKVAEVNDSSECTMEIAKYVHPENDDIIIWDSPGIGSGKFNMDNFEETIGGFDKYDFFLILTDSTFKENAIWLAKQIRSKKKYFYFVRTKIDDSVKSAVKRKLKENTGKKKTGKDEKKRLKKKIYDEQKTAVTNETKNSLEKSLAIYGFDIFINKVYLVDNYDEEEYDLTALQIELCEKSYKMFRKDQLIRTITSRNEQLLDAKHKYFKNQIFGVAAASGVAGLVPVPGTSLLFDIYLVMTECSVYYESLGLNRKSVAKFEEQLEYREGILMKDFEAKIEREYPLIHDMWRIDDGKAPVEFIVLALLKEVPTLFSRLGVLATSEMAESALKVIPVVGSIAGGGLSFLTTCYQLRKMLTQFVEAAKLLRSLPQRLPSSVVILGRSEVGKTSLVESLTRSSSDIETNAPRRVYDQTSRVEKHVNAEKKSLLYYDTPGLNLMETDIGYPLKLEKFDALIVVTGFHLLMEDRNALKCIKSQNKKLYVVGSKQNVNYKALLRDYQSEQELVSAWQQTLRSEAIEVLGRDFDTAVYIVDPFDIQKLETKALYDEILVRSAAKEFNVAIIGRSLTGKTTLTRTLSSYSFDCRDINEWTHANFSQISFCDTPALCLDASGSPVGGVDNYRKYNLFLLITSCSQNSDKFSPTESHAIGQILQVDSNIRFLIIGGPPHFMKAHALSDKDTVSLKQKIEMLRNAELGKQLEREKNNKNSQRRIENKEEFGVFILDSVNPQILDFEKLIDRIMSKANLPFRVAVLGDKGCGKSTLVRALVRNHEAGPTTRLIPYGLSLVDPVAQGWTDAVAKLIGYRSGFDYRINLWDTPGFDLIDYKKYDFFIIVASDGLGESEIYQIKRIIWHGKEFAVVKSKAAEAIVGTDDVSRRSSESQLRENMLNNLNDILQSLGLKKQTEEEIKYPVFLVDSHKTVLYDFRKLKQMIHEGCEFETWLRR